MKHMSLSSSRRLAVISSALVFLVYASAAPAQPPGPPGQSPTDVNVVNTESNPVPVTVVNGNGDNSGFAEYRVVGFSADEVPANIGLGGMHAECDSAFPGMDARMCTTEEVVRTPGLSQILTATGIGWVQPVGVTRSFFSDGVNNWHIVTESTGARQRSRGPLVGIPFASLDCFGWVNSNAGTTGTVVAINAFGVTAPHISTGPCDATRAVTCCAPR